MYALDEALREAPRGLILVPETMRQPQQATFLTKLLLRLIRAYQWAISPLLGNVCRFEPSCSRYAAACIETHGPWRGALLSAVRLCKCHPFHPGGVDLPTPASRRTQKVDGS